MRSISLVPKLEVDYKGSIFQNAICLVDIDNDGLNELCVGFMNGELHVYKGIENAKPWKINKDNGSLIVLCGGCIRGSDEILLCTLDTEGRCRLFDHYEEDVTTPLPGSYIHSRPSSPLNELRFVHQEQLHANAKVAILEDIDNDGIAELIVAFTDRFVRIYKWHIEGDEDIECPMFETDEETKSTKTLVKQGSNDFDVKSTLSFSLSLSKDPKQKEISTTPSFNKLNNEHHTQSSGNEATDHVDGNIFSSPYHAVGKFKMVQQFSLLGQIGSVAVCKTAEGLNQVIVSQPNGGYCILAQYGNETGFTEAMSTPTSVESPTMVTQDSYPTFYPLTSNASRSTHHINTEIIGGIKRQKQLTGVIGLCTHDGSFMVLDNTYLSGTNPIKNRSENHWFAMSKLDITNDGDDEIVLCAMNGMTYIIDKERDIVSFNFNENVAAFCAGYYGTNGKRSPCMCYVTLSGKLHIYYDVWIDAMKVKCVHASLIDKIKKRPDLHYILDLFKLPNGDIDHQKLQNLVKNVWAPK